MKVGTTFATLLLLSLSAVARDITNNLGVVYRDAEILFDNPSSLFIKYRDGNTQRGIAVPFGDLSQDLQRQYNFSPEKAVAYRADVARREALAQEAKSTAVQEAKTEAAQEAQVAAAQQANARAAENAKVSAQRRTAATTERQQGVASDRQAIETFPEDWGVSRQPEEQRPPEGSELQRETYNQITLLREEQAENAKKLEQYNKRQAHNGRRDTYQANLNAQQKIARDAQQEIARDAQQEDLRQKQIAVNAVARVKASSDTAKALAIYNAELARIQSEMNAQLRDGSERLTRKGRQVGMSSDAINASINDLRSKLSVIAKAAAAKASVVYTEEKIRIQSESSRGY